MGPQPRIDAGQDGAILHVRVQPRARREGLGGLHGDLLKIALAAPPVDGAANEALLRFLGRLCDVPPSSLRIVRGAGARAKAIEFAGLDVAELRRRLEPPLTAC